MSEPAGRWRDGGRLTDWLGCRQAALAGGCYDHAGWLALAVVVLLAASPWLLRGLQFETLSSGTGVTDLLATETYQRNLERFGSGFPLVVELHRGSVPGDAFDALTDRLATRIASWTEVRAVDARLLDLDDTELVADALRAALANADATLATEIVQRLTPEQMRRQLRRTRRDLVAIEDPQIRSLLLADPLDLFSILRRQGRVRGVGLQLADRSLYFESDDGQRRLLFVYPERPAEDGIEAAALVGRLRRAFAELRGEIPEAGGIDARLAGPHAVAAGSMAVLDREMPWITLVAAALVLGIVWVVFRRWRAVVVCFSPLVVAVLVAVVLARLFFNPLHTVTMAFAPVIIGMGVDALLHCTARLHQLQEDGRGSRAAVCATLADCGPPVTLGLVTTAAAFAVMGLARYRPLHEFGYATALGLLAALVATLVLFPAAVRLAYSTSSSVESAGWIRTTGGRRWALAVLRPRVAAGVALLLFAGSLVVARGFSFEMDLYRNIPAQLPALEADREISEAFGLSFVMGSEIGLRAPSLEAALEGQRRIDEVLLEKERAGIVAGFVSASGLLSYPGRRERLARVGAQVHDRRDEFFAILRDLGFREDPAFSRYWGMLERATAPLPGGLARADRHPRLRRLMAEDAGYVHLRTLVWSAETWSRPEAAARATAEVVTEITLPSDVELTTTGTYEVFHQVNEVVRSDFFRVGGFGGLVVTVILMLFFRSPGPVAVCVAGVLAAVPLMLAASVLADFTFTPSNVGIIAIVIGIGIDDAVHVMSRRGSGSTMEMERILREIGPVLCLTTLTTALAFGTLLLSSFYSVASLGFAVSAGTVACLLYTLVLVPVLSMGVGGSPVPDSEAGG